MKSLRPSYDKNTILTSVFLCGTSFQLPPNARIASAQNEEADRAGCRQREARRCDADHGRKKERDNAARQNDALCQMTMTQ